ncbi:MAG: PIN domain-containing protein [Clostridiales bacterium]|nr:PIN domain-containing protein [Clostridiales bacterium]
MRAVINTNVILDILLKREEFFCDSYSAVKFATQEKNTAFISAGCVSDVHYIVMQAGKDAGNARNLICTLLQLVKVCDTAASDILTALHLDISDFEDAILAATAKREKADFIITRNERDFLDSPVPAVSPKEFLSIVNGDSGAKSW